MPELLSAKEIARYIDHTNLKPEVTEEDIKTLCAEAVKYAFYSVCVNATRVAFACHQLENVPVKVACVVGFPLGAMTSDVKRYETEAAIDDGAQEIDVVLNIGRLKEGNDKYVIRELKDVVEAADERPVKVILETCLLSKEEIVRACHCVLEAEAHFVKTSTGFSRSGATIEDVKLMRETVGPAFGVKASGGIRDYPTAMAMIQAGATRLGTSSGLTIVNALLQLQDPKLSY